MGACEVLVIGAGPSGAVAAALLAQRGFSVRVVEKLAFPRFVIGESLLPFSMEVLKEADLLEVFVQDAGFQPKNGAAFSWGERYAFFDFREKFSEGAGTTYQVRRADFDALLIEAVVARGVQVGFGEEVVSFEEREDGALVVVRHADGSLEEVRAGFVLDGSGYGRVLPRLLGLERPSNLPVRVAKFTHIIDNINSNPEARDFDREKILIVTHPKHRDVWLWLIPFADNRASIGVVGLPELLQGDTEEVLKRFALECPMLRRILAHAVWENEVPYRFIEGYSANVSALYGKRFALLGNASEFLDPVFSSGITIALYSAKLAADTLTRARDGEAVDWQKDFAEPLMLGVDTFRVYVQGWYDGRFQDVVYAQNQEPKIRRMVSSILAGYAWDKNNPFVGRAQARLSALAGLCAHG